MTKRSALALLLLSSFVAADAWGQAARIDQLTTGAAISDTDTFVDCQGCSSVTRPVSVPASAINTYIASKGYALGSSLTLNRILLGGGGANIGVLGSSGTATTLLHGSASGPPTFGPVSLTADISGNLPVGNLNSGTNASNTTVWWGDATWRPLPPAVLPTIANSHILGNASGITAPATDTALVAGGGIAITAAAGTITIASSGTGGVAGPGSSVNTDLACWNGTGGNVLSDCGILKAAVGTVQSVGMSTPGGIFAATGSPVTVTGSLGFSVTGSSGGIPYFSSASALSSSGVLGANLPLFGGGAGAAPIAGTRSGTTTEVGTVSGALIPGNAVVANANGDLVDGGVPPGGGGGSGTVTSSPAGQVAYYGSTGTTVIGNANLTITAGALTAGIAGSVQGSLKLAGATSGVGTIDFPAVAGTPHYTLPAVMGTTGTPLLAGSPMTFGSITGTSSKFATSTGTLTNGDLASWDPGGNVIDSTIAASSVTTASNTQTLTNKSIAASEVNSGVFAPSRLPLASSSAVGGVQGDGSTLSINGSGVISCTTATASQIGCGRPDNTTLIASAGVWTVPAPTILNGHIWANATGGSASPRDTTLAAGSGIGITAVAGVITISTTGSGGGGVSGPGSSVNNDLACWNGTGGNAILDCGVNISNVVTPSSANTLTNKSISAPQINSGTLAAAQMFPLSNGAVYQGNGSSQPVSTTLSAAIDAAIGSTRGSMLERGASGWQAVPPGVAGTVWTSNGAGTDPSYQTGGGGGSTTITLAPGFASLPGTCNTGTQTVTNGSSLSGQTCITDKTANYTVNTDHGLTSDSGVLLRANGSGSITFTAPNPSSATKGISYQFADKTGHGYVVATVGGTASITGCGGTGTTLTVGSSAYKGVMIIDDGTNYACFP